MFSVLLMITPPSICRAQTFTLLHSFTGHDDGSQPVAGVTMGGSGTLYGTASLGGAGGTGTAFKLMLHGSDWIFSPLYEFTQGADELPRGGISTGPGGALYGTTAGGQGTNGAIMELRPPLNICRSALCYWNQTTIDVFDGRDGSLPEYSNLAFDAEGNIYGTTFYGGRSGKGIVYKLTQSGGNWSEKILYDLGIGQDGSYPISNVTIDPAGDLYVTTTMGGAGGLGTVIELTPAGLGWNESVLQNFYNDQNGYYPSTGLVMDPQGNLYGTTVLGGANGGGTVFELSQSGGHWNFSVVYSFTGGSGANGGALSLDTAGDLYGTTVGDGLYGMGMVFRLTNSNGSWTLTDLHDFTGGSDGESPVGGVVVDANNVVYGTAAGGGNTGGWCGTFGCGTAWEITP